MASKKIHLQNGTVVDADWKGLIALSVDGVNWSTFPKEGLQVKQYPVQFTTTGENNINKFNQPGAYVTLAEFSSRDEFLRFYPTDVVNQSWTTGQAAVNEISSWIGEVYP